MKTILFFILTLSIGANAQSFMMNPYGRQNTTLLNGKWNAIIDMYSRGEVKKFYQNRKPRSKTEFIEYSFENGLRLDVPGDFNSQTPELKYYEGNIWYQRYFKVKKKPSNRQFIYFAAVSYEATVWLNGIEIGRHEGGFTPFQFEVTDVLKEGENDLVVLVNNNRRKDGIPAMNFDWWNYGGITRDVFFIETPSTYILDYKLQLNKGSKNKLSGYIKLDGINVAQQVEVSIPELKVHKTLAADENGLAAFEIIAKPQLWEPDSPKMYDVKFVSNGEAIHDKIGFRTIELKGTEILLNGKPIFLKGVNFHEEIPQFMGRACSDADAAMILNEVKALGCNFARTAHYPQNERILRKAEEMGITIWEEIPIWQGIEFTNPIILKKAETMLREMIYRDKNRSNIIIWSVANETWPTPARDSILSELVSLTRALDDTRLVGAAFNNAKFNKLTSTFNMNDNLAKVVDVVGINEYVGWYQPFPTEPENIKWNVANNKPLIMSEFGSEALYGQHGEADVASSWSEEYQENNYKKNLRMFENIPNLSGIAPWVLFDFRSPLRCHQSNQEGWNRKGVVSNKGQRKKAWYVMNQYYSETK
ncbi:beta galactosidase jelly roll domain-containing protein [Sabulilitoribacter arenilitoris]|uniref:Beta-glucuronidase n=1 Tax=Wocania arenilitoris TaxID=2044858 RepID=A0AAE3JMG1_9FLAO|nr:glycoside hydrolase family 2 TIM barrel-domain containing protein [Wocania arenilitoris]MCF7567726.1 beta galactosidase jelly roll domain-containing protein [Wocania arenilitoris]